MIRQILLLCLACAFLAASCDTASVPDTTSVHNVVPDTASVLDTAPASDSAVVDADVGTPTLPESLPVGVAIERIAAGDPLEEDEISAFTATMAEFYGKSDYFRWASWHSHGLADDNEWGEPPFKLWWAFTRAYKEGDTVTFRRYAAPDNTAEEVCGALSPALGLHLATGDEVAGKLALDYITGMSATMEGSVWGAEDPPVETIMARCIFHRNHAYEMEGGRKVVVDYDSVRVEEEARRHDTLHNPNNPTWGDIYVRNKRSKDDLPFIFRGVPFLMLAADRSDNEKLREASHRLLSQYVAMAKDMVQHGYVVRVKLAGGEAVVPMMDDGVTVDDYASFDNYDALDPDGECDAKLATALLAEGHPLDNDCGDGIAEIYEPIAIATHYWQVRMVWGYHVVAYVLALTYGQEEVAHELLEGLAMRMDGLMVDSRAADNLDWYTDVAQNLVLSAAYGLPLTDAEARLVVEQFGKSAVHYGNFDKWDLWDDSVPDGEHDYIPLRHSYDEQGNRQEAFVRIAEIGFLFEYCASPWRDPKGARFVDCDALFRSMEDE